MSIYSQDLGAVAAGSATELLLKAGMSEVEARAKGNLLARCEAALDISAGKEGAESVRFFVPGRVEFLGKHTDYAGGRSLLCAVERGICIVARPREDEKIRIAALDLGEDVEFALSPEIVPLRGSWRNYAMTVARRVARNFPGELRGADIAFASDLPSAAGLSSSSALIIAIFLALRDVNGLERHPAYRANIHGLEDLAGYMGTNENGQTFGTLVGDMGVGTFGGSQDHTAILCCEPKRLSQYAFCPVRQEATLPWPEDYVLAIGVSGVVSEKTGAAMENYNLASMRTAAIVELWGKKTGRVEKTVAAAVGSSSGATAKLKEIILEAGKESATMARLRLGERLDQFLAESDRIIPETAAAIREKKMDRVGKLVDESQKNSETLLGNQVAETIELCRLARGLGAAAASGFGAGFGGAVWAMILRKNSEEFLRRWRERYEAAFPVRTGAANFLVTRPGPAARRV